jgi:DNA-binding XRE family transcriptional regulator
VSNSPYVHAGHDPASPVVRTGDPAMPESQACCVDQHWTVPIDGDRLRRARKRAGLSQEAVADAAGVSVTTVGRLERRDRLRCHFVTRRQLAAAVGAHPKAITAVPDVGAQVFDVRPGSLGPCRTCSATFMARADQLGEARAYLRRMLAGCPLADELVLICSELATNAIEHSAPAGSSPSTRRSVTATMRGSRSRTRAAGGSARSARTCGGAGWWSWTSWRRTGISGAMTPGGWSARGSTGRHAVTWRDITCQDRYPGLTS